MVEGHRNLLENFPKWHQTVAKLIELPDQIDFDLEGLSKNTKRIWCVTVIHNDFAAYVLRMSTVLAEFEDDISSVKTKFTQARKELGIDDVDNHRPKMLHHPRSLAYNGNQLREAERCE